jgi:hypothetical protein
VLAIPVLSMPIAIGSSLGGAVCPRNAENRPNRPVGIRRANLAPTHPHLRLAEIAICGNAHNDDAELAQAQV